MNLLEEIKVTRTLPQPPAFHGVVWRSAAKEDVSAFTSPQDAGFEVDSENATGALGLYESLGFVRGRRTIALIKQVD